jgi:hypothetical protein
MAGGSVVNRYLVDGIVIGGLVVGTLGVFYLSNALFGTTGKGILRWLFLEIGFAIYFAVTNVYLALVTPVYALHLGPLTIVFPRT